MGDIDYLSRDLYHVLSVYLAGLAEPINCFELQPLPGVQSPGMVL